MLRVIGRRVISNHGVRWRKVGEVIVEIDWDKINGMEEGKKKLFFGYSGYLNPVRIRILPQGSFVPGILNNIQQIRQNVCSSYRQDNYR